MSTAVFTVIYDAQCRLCRASRERMQRWSHPGALRFVDAHETAQVDALKLSGHDLLGQMHVIDPDGRVSGGFEALVALLPVMRIPRPIKWLAQRKTLKPIGRSVYRFVARNRYRLNKHSCQDGACAMPR